MAAMKTLRDMFETQLITQGLIPRPSREEEAQPAASGPVGDGELSKESAAAALDISATEGKDDGVARDEGKGDLVELSKESETVPEPTNLGATAVSGPKARANGHALALRAS